MTDVVEEVLDLWAALNKSTGNYADTTSCHGDLNEEWRRYDSTLMKIGRNPWSAWLITLAVQVIGVQFEVEIDGTTTSETRYCQLVNKDIWNSQLKIHTKADSQQLININTM